MAATEIVIILVWRDSNSIGATETRRLVDCTTSVTILWSYVLYKYCAVQVDIQRLVDSHPNIAKVLNLFESPSNLHIVMELLPHGTLFDHL